jgi:hypothetical protein
MRRIAVLHEAGLIDLQLCRFRMWNCESANSRRRSIGHQRGVTFLIANCVNQCTQRNLCVKQCRRRSVPKPMYETIPPGCLALQ